MPEVAVNGFAAAHEEGSGPLMIEDRAPGRLIRHEENETAARSGKAKTAGTKNIRGIDEPLAFDAPGFVDEMHARVNLYAVYKDLLTSQDAKVQQRAIEFVIEMKYGKGAPRVRRKRHELTLAITRPQR